MVLISYNNKQYKNLDFIATSSRIERESLPWKPCFIESKCICKELLLEKQKLNRNSKRTGLSEGKPVAYPNNRIKSEKKFIKIFQMDYYDNISSLTKDILNTCQNKYIYYVIDDIKQITNIQEQQKLLKFLYSSMISLHNDFSINLYDIWIDQINLNYIPTYNKFSKDTAQYFTSIKLKLYYRTRLPIKKAEPIW